MIFAATQFAVENRRLKELALVTAHNRPTFDPLVQFVEASGYSNLQSFVTDQDNDYPRQPILRFLEAPFPQAVALYDRIARPYPPRKAKWPLLGWIFRDAPAQRLQPLLSSMYWKQYSRQEGYASKSNQKICRQNLS